MALISQEYSQLTPEVSTQLLSPLIQVAEVQQAQYAKRIQTLQKQAEQIIEANISYDELQRHRDDKLVQIAQDKDSAAYERAESTARMEALRQSRLAAAAEHEEQMRMAAEAKLHATNERLARFAQERAVAGSMAAQRAAGVEAKRQATLRASQAQAEGRRGELLARQARVEDILQQREQLRQLQLQIRAEEDYLRDQQRTATKLRADKDSAAKTAWLEQRLQHKEDATMRKMKEIAQVRRLHGDRAAERAEYLTAAAQGAQQMAEAERARNAAKSHAKALRTAQLNAARERLMDEMRYIRQQMQMQEDSIRASLTRMRNKGSLALPPDVAAQLQAAAEGGVIRTSLSLSHLSQVARLKQGGEHSTTSYGTPRAPRTPRTPRGSAYGPPRLTPGSASAGTSYVRDHKSPGLAPRARPRSAIITPRGDARDGRSPAAPKYLTVAHSPSPRAGQAEARRPPRPLSASYDADRTQPGRGDDVMRSGTLGSAASPRPATAGTTGAHSAYSAYKAGTAKASAGMHQGSAMSPGTRAAAETLARQQAASAAAAAAAIASRQYDSVSEVARPGSRREDELRIVLQEEIGKEGQRQILLAKVSDDLERARLIRIFAAEREDAKRRILSLSSAVQAPLMYH